MQRFDLTVDANSSTLSEVKTVNMIFLVLIHLVSENSISGLLSHFVQI